MKRIAISQRVQVLSDIGERRDALSQEWADLMTACGFLPLLLPNHQKTAENLLSELLPDGILLTGGNDLASYGGDAPERDAVEHMLVDYSIAHKIPLLGVCRGMQLLLDHFGTPLERVEGHIRVEHLLENGDTVNSFHGWGARSCLPPLKAVHHCNDGVVEGIVHTNYPWICGIMWHPERYTPFRQCDIQWIQEVFSK